MEASVHTLVDIGHKPPAHSILAVLMIRLFYNRLPHCLQEPDILPQAVGHPAPVADAGMAV